MAVFREESESDPWTGICTEVHDDSIRLSWLEGSYSTKWKPCKKRSWRQFVNWEDAVSKSSIILYDFELTKTHLKKSTVSHLKEIYITVYI